MKKAYAIIGSAYGDEGKGLFTDYLSSNTKNNCVVRFNGGAQAGHTVTTPDGLRHVFGSLGSGSFNFSPTLLSSFYVFNPLVFENEKKEFDKLGYSSIIRVNEDAYLSTPFDMILNQLVEIKRGSSQHGSCGLGFGESVQRCENKKYNTSVKMLRQKENLLYSLRLIQKEYLFLRANELGVENLLKEKYAFILTEEFLDKIVDDYLRIGQLIDVVRDVLPSEDVIIFEGAQGLLLDQHIGYFPHVTRSNTGLKNIVDLISQYNGKEINKIEELEIIYATRCYTTRHGAGPLENPLSDKPYPDIIDETNKPNQFQGTLRFAYLDLDLLASSIKKDIELSGIKNKLKFNYKIGITCLDQTETVFFYENKILNKMSSKDFVNYVKTKFQVNVLTSWGPTRATIREATSF